MTDKQRAFVTEYLRDKNATRAATRAGYSPKSAYSSGQRLLKNDEIRAAIDAHMNEAAQEAHVTREMIIQGLLREAQDTGDGTTHGARVTAWKALGDHLGIWAPARSEVKTEHDVTGGIYLDLLGTPNTD